MPNSHPNGPRPNGPRGNGSDAPPWARQLSADVRAMILEMREDRKRADERDARHAREMAKAIAAATRVGILIRHDIQDTNQRIHETNQRIRETNQRIRELTSSIDKMVRVFISRGNGRGNGNGRRLKS